MPLVELEPLGLGPDVGGVEGDVDGKVADDADVLRACVGAQALPLPEEEVLDVDVEVDLVGEGLAVGVEGAGLAHADGGVVPLDPRPHAEVALDGHEQGVVLDPRGVLGAEARDLLGVAGEAPLEGAAQDLGAARVELGVVDAGGVVAPVGGVDLVLGEQAVGHELVEVDQVGVAREGRGALVGGVAEARGTHGQELPPRLAGVGEEVHEVVGGLAHGADAVRRRQRVERHDDCAGPLHHYPLTAPAATPLMMCFWQAR